MSKWMNWRNPVAGFAVAGTLSVVAIAIFILASDLNEASDAQGTVGALSSAAAGVELAWFQAMGADALAATGQAPDESQGFYDGAINLYNSSKAVLAAAGVSQIDQALAASDQGLVAADAAFVETMRLAATGDVVAATNNHMDSTVVLYGSVDPAVKGLALVAQAAEAKLASSLNSAAKTLRVLFGVGIAAAAIGAFFAGWAVWAIYKDEDENALGADSLQSVSMERAA